MINRLTERQTDRDQKDTEPDEKWRESEKVSQLNAQTERQLDRLRDGWGGEKNSENGVSDRYGD